MLGRRRLPSQPCARSGRWRVERRLRAIADWPHVVLSVEGIIRYRDYICSFTDSESPPEEIMDRATVLTALFGPYLSYLVMSALHHNSRRERRPSRGLPSARPVNPVVIDRVTDITQTIQLNPLPHLYARRRRLEGFQIVIKHARQRLRSIFEPLTQRPAALSAAADRLDLIQRALGALQASERARAPEILAAYRPGSPALVLQGRAGLARRRSAPVRRHPPEWVGPRDEADEGGRGRPSMPPPPPPQSQQQVEE